VQLNAAIGLEDDFEPPTGLHAQVIQDRLVQTKLTFRRNRDFNPHRSTPFEKNLA
jgi:hypothetical protein